MPASGAIQAASMRDRSALSSHDRGVGTGVNYSNGSLLVRGGEHIGERSGAGLICSGDRDLGQGPRDRMSSDALPRYRSDQGCRPGFFPVLGSQGASGDDRVVGADPERLLPVSRRRRGPGPSTPPAYPPPPAHLLPTPPSMPHSGGSHASAGSRSLPPGRNTRPHTPSGQTLRRGADEIGNAQRHPGRDAIPTRSVGEATRSRSVARWSGSEGGSSSSGSTGSTCDKCDGKHPTDKCPHYHREREKHKDAWVNYGCKGAMHHMGSSGGNYTLRSARVIRQPGDGSCLFHSLNHGLGSGSSAQALRREIAGFLQRNPSLEISGDTLEEWVRWDANSSVNEYARRMAVGGWGGGIEMAACSLLKNVNVHVYENSGRSLEFKRISCFDAPNAKQTVHVLYQGGRQC